MSDPANFRMVYPEIYYKLQPLIVVACDQIDACSPDLPLQDMVENMSDSIYSDMCRMYPDIADYTRGSEHKKSSSKSRRCCKHSSHSDNGCKKRGVCRDFIDYLLLSELSRRRRRIY